ncbi:MAG TPA: PAS domain-containing protein, partial [Blastocatellia bacterium]|nr:PAS domain-containing protein [Blastocatellia bacterium]
MDTIRTTAAGGEFPLADGPALNEVLSEALDRGGIGLILLQRGQSTISFMNHAARRLFGFSSAQADIQVSDLLTRLAGVDQISVQAGDHPIMRALAGQSGTACGCRIDNGGALTRFVQARYGTVDAATAFVLLEGASPGLDEAADGASTEQRLRAQIKRFYIPTFVWQFLDGDFILREFNDAASAATRGDVDSSVGVAAAQIYQDRPDIREDIQRCFQEKTTISKEIAYQTRSGREPRDWAITYTYVPPDLVMVHAEDITNRKRAEQLLRDREERLRMLVEQVPAILWSTDTHLCVTSTAGSTLAALNATPEQAVGKTLSKLFDVLPGGEQVIAAHKNALRGVSTGYEITFKGRVFQSHVEPLHAQDGSIIGTIGLGRDVTDGKRAERALGQSEERYRAFVAQSSEGIWRLEVEPPIPTSLPADEQAGLMMDRCYVRECNDVMAKMYGLSTAADLVGKSWRALHVEGDSLNLDGLRRFIASGYRTSDSESHDVNASGDIKYFTNNAAGIVEDGKLVRIWGTQQDITQRKASEAERAALLAREKTARLEAETAWLEWRQMFD